MVKKKKHNLFYIILLILFVIYMGLYIAKETGYYENQISNRVRLTSKSINQFEKDIASGKDVTIKDYLKKENKDYSNNMSKLGVAVSKETEKFMSEGIFKIMDVLGKLFS